MIKKTISHGGSSIGDAVISCAEIFTTYIQSFSNVTFYEKFTKGDGVYRYIYKISGFENLFLCLENDSRSNYSVGLSVRTEAHIHDTGGISSNAVMCMTISAAYASVAGFDVYFIAKNGVLKVIGINQVGSVTYPPILIIYQPEANYFSYRSGPTTYIYKDDSSATRFFMNNFNGLFALTDSEKATMCNAAIVSDTATYPKFLSLIDDFCYICNEQFKEFTSFVCVSINGVKYRQVAQRYVFIEDGDTELQGG